MSDAVAPETTSGGHPAAAARFVANDAKAHWHDQALWWVRKKRDTASSVVPDWEALRAAAEAIKAHTLSRIADYVEEFERRATAHGATLEARTFFDRANEWVDPDDLERRWRALSGRETVLHTQGELAAQERDVELIGQCGRQG